MNNITRPEKGPVITLGGLHGVGKSTYGRKLADAFELRYFSTGILFRTIGVEKGLSLTELSNMSFKDPTMDAAIDEKSKETINEGNVVFDSLLASYLARSYDSFRIYLKAPLKIRLCRIARRERKKIDQVEDETLYREKLELERFKRYYEIDISDTSIYHLILDTSILSLEANLKILVETVGDYLEERWFNNVRNDSW